MIEEAARASGSTYAIARPTMYLDSLLKPSALAKIAKDGVSHRRYRGLSAHRLDSSISAGSVLIAESAPQFSL